MVDGSLATVRAGVYVLERYQIGRYLRFPMRRLLDIAVATMALVVLSPLLLAVALAIGITSRSNPLYPGRRIGIAGHEFRMWKFRTMEPGADRGSSITGKRDARVTPLGRVLRKTKLDELPQLFNLLTGDMTLVGPRPEAPDIVARYTPEQRRVLMVKPGVTGISQVSAIDESDTIPAYVDPRQHYIDHILDRKVAADRAYLEIRTVWSDARMILATVGLVWRALAGPRFRSGRESRGKLVDRSKVSRREFHA